MQGHGVKHHLFTNYYGCLYDTNIIASLDKVDKEQ